VLTDKGVNRVAVVGLGIAGLACARALTEAGLEVVCFDKSRGLSGRMATRRGDAGQFDHGAQYFTARDPRFAATLRQWLEQGVVARWTPRLAVFDAAGGPPRVDARAGDVDAGGTGLERFVGTPTMTAPARQMADGLRINHGCTVRGLRRGPAGWRLDMDDTKVVGTHDGSATDGDSIVAKPGRSFDAVVLALPAPQATALLDASRSDANAQELDDISELARSARMRGCWAAMVSCAASLGLPFDAAFVNAGPLRWVARDSSKPGRPGGERWVLHANADWSEAHLEQPAVEVAAQLLHAFAALGAPVLESAGPAPGITVLAHRWRYADSHPPLDRRFEWDGRAAVGLCGDWLHGGRVEGAWLSGNSLAGAMLGRG
jgi:renalase